MNCTDSWAKRVVWWTDAKPASSAGAQFGVTQLPQYAVFGRIGIRPQICYPSLCVDGLEKFPIRRRVRCVGRSVRP
jgi:hypothetical protein